MRNHFRLFVKLCLYGLTFSIILHSILKSQNIQHWTRVFGDAISTRSSYWPSKERHRPNIIDFTPTVRKFIASENGTVFIFGVVAKNSSVDKQWDRLAFYGEWYNHSLVERNNLRCCFKDNDGTVYEYPIYDYFDKLFWPVMYNAELVIWHITCERLPFLPLQVGIARNVSCISNQVTYIEPYFAKRKKPDHLVITTKMAYAKLDPRIAVGFLETAIYLGVDKVLVYVYETLDPRAKTVLQHYAKLGIVEYTIVELADTARVPRNFPPLNVQYINDEWTIIRDSLERNVGSTYFGIFDMDEYLIPSRNRSLKSFLHDMNKIFPNASNFLFKNVHFLTDKMSDNCDSKCSLFRRHIMTSQVRFNNIHEKMILIPDNVFTPTIRNHHVQPIPGYESIYIPGEEAYVRHYGSCKRKFKVQICKRKWGWVKDISMVDWAELTINRDIEHTLSFLNFTT